MTPRWTDQLNAFAMLRIGASSALSIQHAMHADYQ